MKIKILLLIILFFETSCFSQTQDTYQSASFYKENNIRTRTLFFEHGRHHSGTIDYFDHEGLLIETARFDSSGRNYMSRTKYEYDTDKRLASQKVYRYSYFDTIKRKMIIQPTILDSQEVKLDFDELHRLIRRTFFDSSGKILSQMTYAYEPGVMTEQYFIKSAGENNHASWFDEHGMVETMISTYYLPDSSLQTITIKFDNVYDRSGKLKRRIRKTTSSRDPIHTTSMRQEYLYMGNGLLVRKSTYSKYNNKRHVFRELFDYTFW